MWRCVVSWKFISELLSDQMASYHRKYTVHSHHCGNLKPNITFTGIPFLAHFPHPLHVHVSVSSNSFLISRQISIPLETTPILHFQFPAINNTNMAALRSSKMAAIAPVNAKFCECYCIYSCNLWIRTFRQFQKKIKYCILATDL
jgi:hypothetical protein